MSLVKRLVLVEGLCTLSLFFGAFLGSGGMLFFYFIEDFKFRIVRDLIDGHKSVQSCYWSDGLEPRFNTASVYV